MSGDFEPWHLLGGLGLFLFGLFELEQALKALAGRPFKRFVKTHTTPPIKGVLTGIVTTAVLQSSSVVTLIVLAFVGTGIISLTSALSIVFGANLGTTITGWIVATIGFRLDLEALSLPLIAFGSAGVVWAARETATSNLGHFVVGLGLMLMGLGFMKSGAAGAAMLFDPEALDGYPPVVFVLAGVVVTAIVQSSSATLMIALSALHAGVIPLVSAAAVAIGANLGTTITSVIGAVAGSESKKRVAAAAVVFNLTASGIAFAFLEPLLQLVRTLLPISDPLYLLVAFHSLINLIGIAVFLPVITPFSRRLERHFRPRHDRLLHYIGRKDAAIPELAVANIASETRRLLDQVAALNQIAFGLRPAHGFYDTGDDRRDVRVFSPGADHEAAYSAIKELEGEILAFALTVQEAALDAPEAERLSELIPAIRNAVHSAKCVKDTRHDLKLFRDSENDTFNGFLGKFRDGVAGFYGQLGTLTFATVPAVTFETLVALKNTNEALYAAMHADIYRQIRSGTLSRSQISTLLNVNREIYLSNQSLLYALSELLLDTEAADSYASVPVAR